MSLSLTVIGAGKVGQVLARCWQCAGAFRLQQILNRSLPSAQRAAAFIGQGEALADWQELSAADVWMLAVADDQIASVAEQLKQSGLLRAGDIVFHCSGATASSVLSPLTACGAQVASLHPVRSFADPAAVADSFAGTICSLEGDAGAVACLEQALRVCAAQAVQIRAEAKLVYHAAAVFASNYLVTLMETALQAYQAAGVSPDMALRMAAPLAHQTLENVFRSGTTAALTGPIARGDMQLVTRQSAAVAGWDAAAGALYEAMIPLTQQIAERQRHSEK